MAIPDYQTIMLPLLKFAGDQQEHSLREAVDQLAERYFNLTEEERKELLPSGLQEVYFKENVTPNLDSVVLRGEIAKKAKENEQKRRQEEDGKIPPKEEPIIPEPPKKEKEGVIRSITLRAKVPWDKLSEVTKGVIAPLKDEGLPPEITIEVKANSEEGFKRHTLSSKVKETLPQIGGKIEKWEEE